MSSPAPLTQTPPAKLDWSRHGTPAATEFGDIYFSTDGGLDETRAVFLEGCGLPEGWSERDVFTIAELGFGSGLNFLAAWELWEKTRRPNQRLHFVSIEKFPFDKAQLKRALSAWPELASFNARLIQAWPGRVRGIHRLEFGSVTLTLVHEDVKDGLEQLDGLLANAWFLDGFNPSGNLEMWSPDIMQTIAQLSAPGARFATFSVAGAVRRALKNAGLLVKKMPGFGRKRHRLEAELPKTDSFTHSVTPNIQRALIVGGGISGRSLARALQSRGIRFDIIDDQNHPSASGNPAALVKPRFDLQDRPESRFFLSAYLYALRAYPHTAIIDRGVRQIPKAERDIARFKKLVDQAALGESHISFSNDVLDIHSALVVDPNFIFNDFEIQKKTYDPAVARDQYSHVFLAAGYGIKQLDSELALRFSRGQLSWAKPVWPDPTAYGGYAINIGDDALIGATHDRLDDRDPFELRAEDDDRNLNALAAMSGKLVTPIERASRASIRVTSKDTLPILADLSQQTDQSIWAMTGLGSRGFTFAPLLAEALIANICGEVGPLDQKVRVLFSAPERYT